MGKKQPQDHKPKKSAAERVRNEASASVLDDLAGRELTVTGRHGEITVTTLGDPLEWDAEVVSFLREGDYMAAIVGMLSLEDGQRLRALRPSLKSLMEIVMGDGEHEDESEPSLGESQAS